MSANKLKDGIANNRLEMKQYQDNFIDIHPPLDNHEALVAADRCYFCHDAPCVTACPTSIDIPIFIRQIATGNTLGSAKTIFDQNILGGMCARVCPTETLCEQVCVREVAEGKPVKIGFLQRYATDAAMKADKQFYNRGNSTGKKVAIVGAGPAGLSCAHRLSVFGHEVVIYDSAENAGGLNEHGIATYKTVDDFAQAEIRYITDIGGIEIRKNQKLGEQFSLNDLMARYDAVFLAIGLPGVNALGLREENIDGVEDAVEFIRNLRQTSSLSSVPIGRRVVVIGGGMTAIDAAIQAKLLGAEDVTICYRRGPENMKASRFEQELATSKGVVIRHWLQPKTLTTKDGKVTGIELEYTSTNDGSLAGTGETTTLLADQIFTAIGQKLTNNHLNGAALSIELKDSRIKVDDELRTSLDGVWAGGDCISHGEDLTVSAVAHGRDAAQSINKALTA